MRISTVATFFFRRLLSKQRPICTLPTHVDPSLVCEDVQFATTTETFQALSEDYQLLKERVMSLETVQRLLLVDPASLPLWPEEPILRVKEPYMQALLDYIELRALILQEQIRQKEGGDNFS